MSIFVDSICVKILDNETLLQGRGNQLILRAGSSSEFVNKTKTYDKIHKISAIKLGDKHYQIACAAGREILYTELLNGQFKRSFLTKINDWISSIKILNDGSVVLITAHNLVALFEVYDDHAVIKETLKCDENSTLYCSFIHGEIFHDLLFFAGTALGELIIWKQIEKNPLIINRQFMHNGVIFSIDFNDQYLVTSSDDRSIKVFDVNIKHESATLNERQQLFSHTSRVFICKIIDFEGELVFLSAGEDSNLCVWSEAGKLLSKKNVSSSGVLWNLDYDAASASVVTCSSTGKLNKFCLRKILFENHQQLDINLSEGVQPAKLKYLENGALVVLDSKMQIHMKLRHREWKTIRQPVDSQKFVAMEAFRNRVFLIGKSSIAVFDFSEKLDELSFLKELEVKEMLPMSVNADYLRSVHALNDEKVFISDAGGLCFVVDIDQRKILKLFQIPKSAEPWSTSVTNTGELWLVADRVGNLFMYESSSNSNTISHPIQKLWKLHGQLGVTTIRIEPDGIIKTTGNDGTMKTLYLDRKNRPPTIEIRQCEKTSVNWIEKVCWWNGKALLLGFNDNYFTIYHKRQIIYEHSCGGRHRHWDAIMTSDERMNFVYIQKKRLNMVEFMLSDFNYDSCDVDWHTKECNAMFADNGRLLVSGGEDTLIKVMTIRVVDGKPLFREIASINSHISSIKAFATVREGEDLRIFSAGGRAQIVVTSLIGMKHVKEEANFMLFSTNNGNSKDATYDPETRFTDLCYDATEDILFAACSDGFIRVLRFTKAENVFVLQPIGEHFYGNCLLKIHVLENVILTMATDGFICFWAFDEPTKTFELLDKLKHNQNGINCFDIIKSSKGAFLLGTGGDDAGVFITEFNVDGTKISFGETFCNYGVHIAQVTGMKFLSPKILCTTSVDQTICKLEITQSSIKLLERKFTCISDVKGLVLLDDKNFLVFGAGLEVLPNFS